MLKQGGQAPGKKVYDQRSPMRVIRKFAVRLTHALWLITIGVMVFKLSEMLWAPPK